ncbi:hypothetical protein [Fibrella aquatilis]|uniref:Uncharacterized protein n=1 Tax=Fibrella aquatilis TaxID=2817059 RepID=A0A939JWB3_9BACT|nr:hypothetical protein [Fibrella aquatilis]MBO0931732.1 hypothetical protein [Fibrella aquatilis]
MLMTIVISPQRVAVGAVVHDNNWPVESHGAGITHTPPTLPKEPSALSEGLHSVLDVVGMIPVVGELADGANALMYAAEGNYAEAAIAAAAMIPVVGNLATGAKFMRKGSKALKAFLKNAGSLTKTDILQHVQKNVPSLKLKGKSPDGRFFEFVDSRGTTRLKIHPPDKVTPYDHIHIYNRRGQPLDANLQIGDAKSADVHIKINP